MAIANCPRIKPALVFFMMTTGSLSSSGVLAWDYVVEDFKGFFVRHNDTCYSPSEVVQELFGPVQSADTEMSKIGVFQVGSVDGVEVVEAKSLSIQPGDVEGDNLSSRWEAATGRSVLLFRNSQGNLCPFYDSPVDPNSIIYTPPTIEVMEDKFLVRIAMRISGSGGFLNLHHFAIQNGEPVYIDHRTVLEQVESELLDSHAVEFHRGESIQGSEYSIAIAEEGACGACASGTIYVDFGIENDAFVVRNRRVSINAPR